MNRSLNNQIVSIYSKIDNNLFLDKTSINNGILYNKNRAINQKLYLVYNDNSDQKWTLEIL